MMAASKLRPSPAPTIANVLDHLVELHNCLEAVAGEVTEIKDDVGHIKERVAKVEGYQAGMATRFNLPGAPEKPSFWMRWSGVIKAGGAAIAACGSFVAAYPWLRGLVFAVDAYLQNAPHK